MPHRQGNHCPENSVYEKGLNVQMTPAARQKYAELAKAANLFKSGQLAAAAAYSRQLLKRYPREALLFNILGGVAAENEDWRTAEKYFAKGVRVDPRNFEILRNLAKAQLNQRIPLKAEQNLKKALTIKPDFVEGWNTLGLVYLEKNEPAAARKAFLKALDISPGFAEAAANVLTELEASNDLEGLESALVRFEKHLPDNPVTSMCRGLVANRKKDYQTALSLLESITFAPGSALENKALEAARTAHMAKLNDRLGHYEAAYRLFILTNRQARENTPQETFDAEGFRKHIALRRDYFATFSPAKWPEIETPDAEPVFMVGFPRSGTTLLDTFLRGHGDIAVTEELPLVQTLVGKLGTNGLNELSRLEKISGMKAQNAGEAYLRELRKHAGDSPVRIDRMPFNILRAGEILRVFPKAKFILALRDPADVIFSCFMQNFVMNDANANFMTPESSAEVYDETFSLWQLYTEKLDFPYFTLRYEDVVEDAETALRPLVDFLGLDWDPAMLDHQKTAQSRERIKTASYAQVVQPIYKTALRRWEHYADMMPGALETVRPWREYFGYNT